MNGPSLGKFYEFDHIEEEFLQLLDESLNPRGPDMMYDVVAGFGLPRGPRVLDVGCGRGERAIALRRSTRRGARTRSSMWPISNPPTASRVLRPGGKVIVFQMFNADRMEPKEAELILGLALGAPPGAADPARLERAVATAGLTVDECIDFSGEWGEYRQETSGDGARRLLHASRILREPDRYIERFGQINYDIMLADAFWHIYCMIGKLTGRIYVLTA